MKCALIVTYSLRIEVVNSYSLTNLFTRLPSLVTTFTK